MKFNQTLNHINMGASVFEVDKERLGNDIMKIRRWYIDDYRRFDYIGSKA